MPTNDNKIIIIASVPPIPPGKKVRLPARTANPYIPIEIKIKSWPGNISSIIKYKAKASATHAIKPKKNVYGKISTANKNFILE